MDYEEFNRKESIKFFQSLINFRTANGKSTRPSNFTGHIGRHMYSEQKKWFLDKYPNNSDYVKFFLDNEDVFTYDCMTGEVRLNSFVDPIEKPKYLKDLEVITTNANSTLELISKRVTELEFFLMIFKQFTDSYESSKTITIEVKRLVQLFSDKKYGLIEKQISSLIPKNIGFDKKMIEYLRKNYEQMFLIDEQNDTISLNKSVINTINKVSKEIDETVYNMFKSLIAKYLRCNGGKDVNYLKESISKRHHIIVNKLFTDQKQCEEFTLLDFIDSYSEEFVYRREVDSEGNVKRIINVRFGQKVEQKHNSDTVLTETCDPTFNTTQSKSCESNDKNEDMKEHEEEKNNEDIAKKRKIDVSNEPYVCCVCQKDDSNELMSYSDYQEFVVKHKRCLLLKLIDSMKREYETKFSALKVELIETGVQTISTGNVKPRQPIGRNN